MRKVTRTVDDPTAKWGFRIIPATYEEAEKITVFRLDRRHNYSINREGEVEVLGVCSVECSGCSCDCSSCSYGYNAHPAAGCRECGYTGRSRMYFGYPPSPPRLKKAA
ncbi:MULTISPECIES: hypothetical protein [unclassified Pseudomonas]|jgi:hypothetical protein|uniref:hypothetical protein n=1 Tax=unclassified Pseudomonas TaxID=196821 RepID=UPI0011AFAE95|nr:MULTISPECIES: hypothetical protein [unclassified Pseudomonas]